MSKINSLTILGLFFFLQLSLLSAVAEKDKNEFSFVSYKPISSEYPDELRPLIKLIEDALASKDKEQKTTNLESALSLSKSIDNKIDRALIDQIFFLRGYILEMLEREEEALTAYKEAIKHRGNNLLALFRHANLLKKQHKCSEAIPEFREIKWQVDKLKSNHLSAEIDHGLGHCLLEVNKTEEGMRILASSYSKNPKYLPALKEKIKKSTELLQKPQASVQSAQIKNELINNLRELKKQDPNDQESALQLARMLIDNSGSNYRKQELSEAAEILNKLVEDSHYQKAELVRMLVQAHSRKGDLEQAEKTLTKGLEAQPKASELLEAAKQLELDKELQQNEQEGKKPSK